MRFRGWTTERRAALVRGKWKIIKNAVPAGRRRIWRLYQLAEDPGERKKLSARY